MIVVTAGTAEYRQIIKAQAHKCREYNYDHKIYDLGGLSMGEPFEMKPDDLKPQYWGHSLPPATFKTSLMLKTIIGDKSDMACWLDGDCLPIRPFIPDGDWDAAVTMRPAGELGRSGIRSMDYINSGAVWIRSLEFAIEWQREALRLNTDQGALNEMIGPKYFKDQWRESIGKTIKTESGYTIKILDGKEWNCWLFPPAADARILHFKRRLRDRAATYCK